MTFDFYTKAPKEIVTTCNLCGGNRFVLVSLEDRYGLEAPTVRCQGCGLVFLSFRMTAEAYCEFYREGHFRRLYELWVGHRVTSADVEADQARYGEILSVALSDHMPKYRSGLLLDVGGSNGVVADLMAHDYDLDATVMEPSADEARRARDRGLTVIQSMVEDYTPNGNRYDVVLLCRSVEHLLDVAGALRRIRAVTSLGGLFFVDFVRPGLGYKIDHPYYPNLETMGVFLRKAGFEPKKWMKGPDYRHFGILAEAV